MIIYPGYPQVCVAISDISFEDAGVSTSNIYIIYVIANPIKSFVPGRAINGVTDFEVGKSYYIISKQEVNLNAYVGQLSLFLLNNTLDALIDSDAQGLLII